MLVSVKKSMQRKKNAKTTRKKRCLHCTVHFTAGLRIRIQLFTLMRIQGNADIDQQPCWIGDPLPFRPRNPNLYFESSMTIFWIKSSIILCKLAQIFFYASKKNNLQFCDICGYKKGGDKFFSPLSSGCGINIPDPQHW
jgi:hypothetical protein